MSRWFLAHFQMLLVIAIFGGKQLQFFSIFRTEKTIMNDQTPKSAKSLPTNNLMISDSSTMENLPSQRELKFRKKVYFLTVSNVHNFALQKFHTQYQKWVKNTKMQFLDCKIGQDFWTEIILFLHFRTKCISTLFEWWQFK